MASTNEYSDLSYNRTYQDMSPTGYEPATGLYYIITGIISIATFLTNATVILVVLKNKTLQSNSNRFLTSLAGADMLFGLCSSQQVIHDIVWGVRKTQSSCVTVVTFASFLITETLATLALMTVDRYLAIVHPVKYKVFFTVAKANTVILVSWSYGTVVGLVAMAQAFKLWKPEVALSCITENMTTDAFRYFLLAYYILVILFLVFAYIRIVQVSRLHHIRVAERQAKQRRSTENTLNLQSSVAFTLKLRATKVTAIIVGTTVACLLPNMVHLVLVGANHDNHSYKTLRYLRHFGLVLSSFTNPLIYILQKKEFQQAIYQLICTANLRVGAQSSTASPPLVPRRGGDLLINNLQPPEVGIQGTSYSGVTFTVHSPLSDLATVNITHPNTSTVVCQNNSSNSSSPVNRKILNQSSDVLQPSVFNSENVLSNVSHSVPTEPIEKYGTSEH